MCIDSEQQRDISTLVIPTLFKNSYPRKEKIEKAKEYYFINRKLDKPLTIVQKDEEDVLVDGYARYCALEELNVQRAPVIFSDFCKYKYVFIHNTRTERKIERKNKGLRNKSLKEKILEKQGNCCHYCGKKLEADEITIDHLLPRSRGGKTDKSNLAICCGKCNSEKSSMTEQEYWKYLEIKKLLTNEKEIKALKRLILKDYFSIKNLNIEEIKNILKKSMDDMIFDAEALANFYSVF